MDELELTEETKGRLREKQTKLVKIIEAYVALESSKEWGTLKELVFTPSLNAIERQLLQEALTTEVKLNKIYKLQGEWAWAKQYNDPSRLIETCKKQLENIKNKLK